MWHKKCSSTFVINPTIYEHESKGEYPQLDLHKYANSSQIVAPTCYYLFPHTTTLGSIATIRTTIINHGPKEGSQQLN
jgi:hypothetical protein